MAILGILPVNAPHFAYASQLAEDPLYPGGASGTWAAWVVHLGFEYKFITLFAFLFGLGIGLQTRRAQRGDSAATGVLLRRLFALAGFGVLHAVFLWWGDVVFVYAVLGLGVMWAAGQAPRALTWVASGVLTLYFAAIALLALIAWFEPSGFQVMFDMPHADGVGGAAATGSWGEFFGGLQADDPDFEVAIFSHGPYGRALVFRVIGWIWSTFFSLLLFSPRLVPLMLLGMAAVRHGAWLDPDHPIGRRMHRFALAIALPIGLLLELGATAIRYGTTAPGPRLAAEVMHQIGSLGMAAGIAAVVAILVARRAWSRPLAAVGRTAFSCYIGQSILMTTLFYGHGFALFGRVERGPLLAIVAAVWTVELIAATLWLRSFRMGPLEWLWRSVTYGRLQPLRRRSP